MEPSSVQYDPRYLAGIVLFNRGEFFEAHEVWESIWMEEFGPDRKFYQGLIQAAVALCHFCNGNAAGALKLYKSSRDYMNRYGTPFLGLDQTDFWGQMDRCFAELVASDLLAKESGALPPRKIDIQEALIPTMTLQPSPDAWPDPAAYLHEDG